MGRSDPVGVPTEVRKSVDEFIGLVEDLDALRTGRAVPAGEILVLMQSPGGRENAVRSWPGELPPLPSAGAYNQEVIYPMTAESASDRQQQWELVVRRSFGIPDLVSSKDAREALVESFQDQLLENGWQSLTRGTAEPIVDALMALGASGDQDDGLFPPRDAAYRLIDKGLSVIDPERLAFDMMFEYPPEVVAAVEQMLVKVSQHAREQPLGD
jgi:hypothetical protein